MSLPPGQPTIEHKTTGIIKALPAAKGPVCVLGTGAVSRLPPPAHIMDGGPLAAMGILNNASARLC